MTIGELITRISELGYKHGCINLDNTSDSSFKNLKYYYYIDDNIKKFFTIKNTRNDIIIMKDTMDYTPHDFIKKIKIDSRYNKIKQLKMTTMNKIKIGNNVHIKDSTALKTGLPYGILFTIDNILNDKVKYQIVLSSKELGNDRVQFFKHSEIIPIKK